MEVFQYATLEVHLVDAQEIEDSMLLGNNLKIFVVANTGEGEPPDNSVSFHARVRRAIRSGEDVKMFGGDYFVYGLADSQYENFNAMGVFYDKNVQLLGGNRIIPEFHSDDDDKPIFDKYHFPWLTQTLPRLFEHYDEL